MEDSAMRKVFISILFITLILSSCSALSPEYAYQKNLEWLFENVSFGNLKFYESDIENPKSLNPQYLEVFPFEDTDFINAVFDLEYSNPKSDMSMTFRVEFYKPNGELLDEFDVPLEIRKGEENIEETFSANTLMHNWDTGAYTVMVYLEDDLVISGDFVVLAPLPTATPTPTNTPTPTPTNTPTNTPTPTPTNTPTPTATATTAAYIPSYIPPANSVELIIRNNTDRTLTLVMTGPIVNTFYILKGEHSIWLPPGSYSFSAYSCGNYETGWYNFTAYIIWTWTCY